MTFSQFWCGVKTRHRRELLASAGTHTVRLDCERCGRSRTVDLDTGARPVASVPIRHSLAPRFSDRFGK